MAVDDIYAVNAVYVAISLTIDASEMTLKTNAWTIFIGKQKFTFDAYIYTDGIVGVVVELFRRSLCRSIVPKPQRIYSWSSK